MPDFDRAITLTFSIKISEVEKLEALTKRTGKNRSELLSAWLNREFDALELSMEETKQEVEGQA